MAYDGVAAAVAVWDTDGAANFLDLVAGDPLLPPWRLVTLCGLRRGEVGALRGDDFDFTDSCVRITKQVHVDGPRRWTGPPKSAAGTRVVPLDDVTNELCRRLWLAVATDPRRAPLNPDGAMFLLPDGRPVSPDYLTRQFARLVTLHDLPPIRLHDLRHEAASLMGAAGVEPHVIQQVLGHSSAVTTVDTYRCSGRRRGPRSTPPPTCCASTRAADADWAPRSSHNAVPTYGFDAESGCTRGEAVRGCEAFGPHEGGRPTIHVDSR